MVFNYAQDKLMLSDDFPSFDSTMSVSRPMLVCHLFTVGVRGRVKDELVSRKNWYKHHEVLFKLQVVLYTLGKHTSGCKLF
jgi:hypothetical protein